MLTQDMLMYMPCKGNRGYIGYMTRHRNTTDFENVGWLLSVLCTYERVGEGLTTCNGGRICPRTCRSSDSGDCLCSHEAGRGSRKSCPPPTPLQFRPEERSNRQFTARSGEPSDDGVAKFKVVVVRTVHKGCKGRHRESVGSGPTGRCWVDREATLCSIAVYPRAATGAEPPNALPGGSGGRWGRSGLSSMPTPRL